MAEAWTVAGGAAIPVSVGPPEVESADEAGFAPLLEVQLSSDRRRRAAEIALSHAVAVYSQKTGVLSIPPGQVLGAVSMIELARVHASAVRSMAEDWYAFLLRAERDEIETSQ